MEKNIITKDSIMAKISEYREWMIEVRRHLHQYPEVGDEEYKTTEYIIQLLEDMGIETQRILPTGVVGILQPGKSGGKCIAIRADIDALPIMEEADVPFHSLNKGVMHACGHDMHMAALLCSARILSDFKSALTAPVKFFFQPAEETDGGAQRMIEAGCLNDPEVSHVIGYHVDPELVTGQIGVKYGFTHASSDMFDIIVNGTKSHGAYPNQGIDSIVAAAQIVTSMQSIVSRNIAATDNCVITIGKFHGGNAGNVICDRTEMSGTMRSTSAQTRETVMKRMREVVEGTAAAFGTSAEINFRPGYIAQENNDYTVDKLIEAARETIGEENIVMKSEPSMGVEDFAFYSAKKPSAFFFVGTGFKDSKNYGIHHGLFKADESALDIAVALELLTATKLMTE